jgi:hypothetical protein
VKKHEGRAILSLRLNKDMRNFVLCACFSINKQRNKETKKQTTKQTNKQKQSNKQKTNKEANKETN